jgi:hypothetical protein
LKGRPTSVALGHRRPFEDVNQLLIGFADRNRLKADLLDPVLLEQPHCDILEPLEQIRQAPGIA